MTPRGMEQTTHAGERTLTQRLLPSTAASRGEMGWGWEQEG